MNIKYEMLRRNCYIYILLPVFCFLLFYMHSVVGIFFAILLGISCFFLWKDTGKNEFLQGSKVSWRSILIFGLIAVVWSFLGGQGNLYYQSSDWGCRNAIFRDLVYRDWPVIYAQYDKALVYYIGYWLPVASIVKLLGFLIPVIYESECAFVIANLLLWLWTSIGIFLVELLLVTYVKLEDKKYLFLIPIVLIFFSGMDFAGVLREVVEKGRTFGDLHIEWWSQKYQLQFSSMTTCLFWVFNQAVIPWIVVLMLLQESNEKYYVLLGLGALTSGPIPCMGIIIYMIMFTLTRGIAFVLDGQLRKFLKEMFSLSNIFSFIVFFVFLLYYQCNRSIQTGQGSRNGILFHISVFSIKAVSTDMLKEIFLFVMLEAGIYLILLYKINKGDIAYYTTVASLVIAPFVTIGGAGDFTMRFSIPAIMVLAAMCLKEFVSQKGKVRIALLWCVFLIGAITPLTEFMRGYNAILTNGKIANVYDNVVTFDQECIDYNFMSYEYEDTFFYRYLVGKK